MIDTQIHCDWNQDPKFAYNYPVPPTENQYNDQLAWLKNELELTKNHEYVFVAGHYHMHSPSSTTRCLSNIEDLITEYKVTSYVCGHVHYLSHIITNRGLNQITSGLGALHQINEYPNTNPDVTEIFHRQDIRGFPGGFATITVTKESATVGYYFSKDGDQPIFEYKMQPRNRASIRNDL